MRAFVLFFALNICNTYGQDLYNINFKYVDIETILYKLHSKSYTLLLEEEKMEKESYYDAFKISEEQHIKDYDEYKIARQKLLGKNKSIIKHLLYYENNLSGCNWINTINPYLSVIPKHLSFNKSTASLILIDYYLLGKNNDIKRPIYYDNLSYKKLKRFFKKNYDKPLNEIRELYTDFSKSNFR